MATCQTPQWTATWIYSWPTESPIKNHILRISVLVLQMEHQRAAVLNPFFELKLKRAALLEDTFTQLAAAPHGVFKKPLVVNIYLRADDENRFHVLIHIRRLHVADSCFSMRNGPSPARLTLWDIQTGNFSGATCHKCFSRRQLHFFFSLKTFYLSYKRFLRF